MTFFDDLYSSATSECQNARKSIKKYIDYIQAVSNTPTGGMKKLKADILVLK